MSLFKNKRLLQKLNNYLSANKNIIFAYIFGSYAKGEQTQNSDVDIAIFLKNDTLDDYLQINYEISKLLKKDADIIVLNRVRNIYLLESILKDGIVLKDAPKRIDFELIKQHQILDFKAFKRMINAA